MKDFLEVGHSGVEFKIEWKDGVMGVSYSSCTPTPLSMFELLVSKSGKPLEFIPCYGNPEDVQEGYRFIVPSDSHGLFGFECFNCKKYFRTEAVGEKIYCPYCEKEEYLPKFLTGVQQRYIEICVQRIQEAVKSMDDAVIKADDIVESLDGNRSPFGFTQESQQHKFSCKSCRVTTDILGVYGSCPLCCKRNNLDVYDSVVRGEVSLDDVVSAFEGAASDVKELWLKNDLPSNILKKIKGKI